MDAGADYSKSGRLRLVPDSDRRSLLGVALLAHLARAELSGYDLAASMRFPVGLFWHATQSQIYRELTVLERDGKVTVRDARGRRGPQRRVYAITEAGVEALRAWLAQPYEPGPVRDEVTLRTYAMWLNDRDGALRFYSEMRDFWRERLRFFEEVIASWRERAGERLSLANTPEFANFLTMLRGRSRAREQLRFCEEAIEAVEGARAGTPDTSWYADEPLRHRVTTSPLRPTE